MNTFSHMPNGITSETITFNGEALTLVLDSIGNIGAFFIEGRYNEQITTYLQQNFDSDDDVWLNGFDSEDNPIINLPFIKTFSNFLKF